MRLLVALLCLTAFADDFRTRFYEVLKEKDLEQAEQVLKEWKTQSPKDIELLVGYANLHIRQARQERITISGKDAEKGDIILTDTKTGKVAGALSSVVVYDQELLDKAASSLEEALRKSPRRLDIHYGVMTIHRLADDFPAFEKALKRTLGFTSTNAEGLLWTNDTPYDGNPAATVPDAMQDHVFFYYKKDTPEGRQCALSIAMLIDKHYPNRMKAVNAIGAIHAKEERWEKALPFFLRAEEMAPDDSHVLVNLGICYEQKGNKERALKYYRRIVELDANASHVKYAKKQIAALEE